MSKNNKIPQYNFKKIEKKWRNKWEKDKSNQPDLDKVKKPFYNLMMFPYPSAEGLHIGGVFTFTGVDTFGRYKKMQGYDVFEPIGLDGFGIHAENYAMKIGEHIKKVSERTEKNFYRQLGIIGNMYDWSRTVETYKPEYYKWTQWLFLQMYKKGLAYQKKAKVNWCPSCKTVLSDEQVIAGKCERCESEVEKKELKQWFFAITKYADKLLKNLEWIDWPEDVKLNQRNWIGKSEGAVIKFKIQNSRINPVKFCNGAIADQVQMDAENKIMKHKPQVINYLEVFTTRPDTIFGATYMVIAPEHQLISNNQYSLSNYREVHKYVEKALGKSEQERKAEEKEKTGIELKGVKAINPATGKEIPIWVADYVLSDYGTGAIMAVPAHDERDFEFAKKYGLKIKQVVAPYFENKDKYAPKKNGVFVKRKSIFCIVKNPRNNKYLVLNWHNFEENITFIVGGVKNRETLEEAGRREIREETGYKNLKFIKQLAGEIHSTFYAKHKNENRYGITNCLYFELKDEEQGRIKEEERKIHEYSWLNKKEIDKKLIWENWQYYWDALTREERIFSDDGVNIDSDFLNGLETKEAKKKIIKWLEKTPLNPPLQKGETIGKKAVDYKLRDWCVSRQRYWGPPIPMIYCKKCGISPVSEKDLPVKLPPMDDFQPEGKGKGPLAKNKKFVKTKCPVCGGEAERETDVSDPFVDSSWYFLRYPSTEFNDKIFDKKRTKKWLPVNSYIGGKEHTVLHLLYSRFVTMVLKDLGYVDFDEPYKKFIGHGLITKDGAKMSKSKGNVINPDEMIEKYGADTTRLYLRFLGDFYQGGDWRDSGMTGMHKFVKRLWNTFYELCGLTRTSLQTDSVKSLGDNGASADSKKQVDVRDGNKGIENLNMLDKTIKSVGEDLEKLSFNTAVARIMELVNWINENKNNFNKKQADKIKKVLALIIAPLAPHIAEEFWQETRIDAEETQMDANNKKRISSVKAPHNNGVSADRIDSVFNQEWPRYNPKNIIDDEIEIAVQINGKLRDTIKVSKDISQKDVIKLAKKQNKIKKYLADQKIKKEIFVPGRLINIVF